MEGRTNHLVEMPRWTDETFCRDAGMEGRTNHLEEILDGGMKTIVL